MLLIVIQVIQPLKTLFLNLQEFSLRTGGLVRPCNSFACVTVELLLGRIAVLRT